MAQPTSSRFLARTGIGVDVGQDDETLFDQAAGGLQGGGAVGEEVLVVGDDLQLDEVGLADLAAQAGDEHGFLDGGAARGVGQHLVLAPVDVVQERLGGGVVEVEAADGDGDHLGAGSLDGGDHFLHGAVAARADDEPRVELLATDDQFVRHFDPAPVCPSS